MASLGQIAYEACPDSPHKRVAWADLSISWREYWEAIASAVAAAPDLYAALRQAHEVLSQCEPINCTADDRANAIKLAGAALAKVNK